MKFTRFAKLLLPACLLLAGSHTSAQQAPADTTIEGLQLIKDSNLALVYAEPGIDLRRYNKVLLGQVYVAFKKNWQREQNKSHPHRVSANDMLMMKAELASLFRDVFAKTLEEGGYELTSERGEDVLLLKPAIINLDVVAPDIATANQTTSYAESSGEMTLYLELYDSLTDDLLAKALDRKIDRHTGYFQWQNHVTNRAAANRILQLWATVLKEGLDEARGGN